MSAESLDLQAIGAATIAEFAPRPFQVGDRVRITGWGSYGPHEGTIARISPADPGGRFGPYIVLDAKYAHPDGTPAIPTCSINDDLTAPTGGLHTVELLAAAEEDDGTEAEALAIVEVPRSRFAPPADSVWDPRLPHPGDIDEGPVRPRYSQAGLQSLRGVA
jgi:hypothetical protein